MSQDAGDMFEDAQERIQQLAYLMWESAGRQQGLATQYWLQAEQEIRKTLEAAASRVSTASGKERKAA
jgi:hypothetical protein